MSGILKYPGGKGRQKYLLDMFHLSFDQYREPFCGNAPFLAETEVIPLTIPGWINDLNVPLINYLLALRDNPDFIPRFQKLRGRIVVNAERKLDAFLQAVRDLKRMRPYDNVEKFRAAVKDPTHYAISYLLLTRLAHRNVVQLTRQNIANIGYQFLRAGLLPLTTERMERARQNMQGVKITNHDYSVTLTTPVEKGQRCMMLVDPPYRVDKTFYDHDLTDDDHRILRNRLAALNPATHQFLLTIDALLLIQQLYRLSGDFYVWDDPYKSHMRQTDKDVSQLIVTNYAS